MLTIHLMEAHEFNPIESVSYKAELADSLTNDTSAAQGMCFEFSRQIVWAPKVAIFSRYLGTNHLNSSMADLRLKTYTEFLHLNGTFP